METSDKSMLLAIDKMQIRDALSRYCRGIDRGDIDLMLSTYHEDARESHGPISGTPLHCARIVMDAVSKSEVCLHMLTNVLIEISGDIAASEAHLYIISRMKGEDTETHIVGRMLDRFEKRSGEWKVAERLITSDWSRTQAANPLPTEVTGVYAAGRHDMADPVYRAPHLILKR